MYSPLQWIQSCFCRRSPRDVLTGDAGVGIAFGHKWGGRFFAEARYDRIFTGNYHTDYLPVTFGYRR